MHQLYKPIMCWDFCTWNKSHPLNYLPGSNTQNTANCIPFTSNCSQCLMWMGRGQREFAHFCRINKENAKPVEQVPTVAVRCINAMKRKECILIFMRQRKLDFPLALLSPHQMLGLIKSFETSVIVYYLCVSQNYLLLFFFFLENSIRCFCETPCFC